MGTKVDPSKYQYFNLIVDGISTRYEASNSAKLIVDAEAASDAGLDVTIQGVLKEFYSNVMAINAFLLLHDLPTYYPN